MAQWRDLPSHRLLADVSLWSADLVNLQRDIERMEKYADSFHIDVADSRFVPSLLFFPDLVAAIRPLTSLPLHIHLVVDRPSQLLADFAEAGGDLFTVHVETGEAEIRRSFDLVRERGKEVGLALRLDTPIETAQQYLSEIDAVLLLNTRAGVKGQGLAPEACQRIEQMAELLTRNGLRDKVKIVADGAIRDNTVPLLRISGADVIVPGSLAFGSDHIEQTFAWIHSL